MMSLFDVAHVLFWSLLSLLAGRLTAWWIWGRPRGIPPFPRQKERSK